MSWKLSWKCIGLAGRLETQAGSLCHSLEGEFLLLFWESSDFAQNAFNELVESHPHFQGQSPSLSLFTFWDLSEVKPSCSVVQSSRIIGIGEQ